MPSGENSSIVTVFATSWAEPGAAYDRSADLLYDIGRLIIVVLIDIQTVGSRKGAPPAPFHKQLITRLEQVAEEFGAIRIKRGSDNGNHDSYSQIDIRVAPTRSARNN